jgi:hypothetical protein
MAEIKAGTKEFRERVPGVDNAKVRVMEALGIISPTKTPAGWRQFSNADIRAARSWLAANSTRRKRA